MKNPFSIEDIALDEAIASAHSDLANYGAETDEYQKAVDQLSKLYKLRNDNLQSFQDAQLAEATHMLQADAQAYSEEQDELPFYRRVDPNTVLTVAGNILIGLAVIKYEQTGVISSKVMSFMKKI